ncbi:MAG: hypothetical protein AAF065_09050 [Verrucomicrobiota bacterium]
MNPSKELRCPECDGLVFNRRYPKCEHCGADLPKEFRLTEKEKEEANELRNQQRMKREKENWSFLYDRDPTSGGDGGYVDV